MAQFESADWIARQKPATRIALLFMAIIMALFVAGVLAGFAFASVEHGHILPRKPLGWVVIIAALLAGYGLYRAIRLLLRPGLSAGLSAFEQRYSKMWLLVMLLGVPVGIGLTIFSLRSDPAVSLGRIFTDGTLPPGGAVLMSTSLVLLLGVAAILYHRAIDDHEERAYLWARSSPTIFWPLPSPSTGCCSAADWSRRSPPAGR